MSIWTHVNGSIRIDGLFLANAVKEEQEINKIVGKIVTYDDLEKMPMNEEPKTDLPMGSEGSLHYKFVFYGQDSEDGTCHSVSRGSILIWGDLRDFDNSNEVVEWFKNLISKISMTDSKNPFFVRDAILDVYTEGRNRFICVQNQNNELKVIQVADKFEL